MKIPEHSRDLIYTDWTLTEANFDPEQLWARETVFTIGNGYLGTRGSFEEGNDRVSVPAKTLSGFGYRGHIFWDTEIFILPFFTFTQPAIARSLLTYRYHTLAGARRKAAHSGYKGAMFAWESATTGEATPQTSISTDPYAEVVRIWCRDREIHLSADIAYAVWHYWQATGDDHWLRDYGAEIILDTALFWMSRLEWHAEQERYELCGVIGADEYHERVNNNALTNRMVQWHLEKAVAVYEWLQQTFPSRAVDEIADGNSVQQPKPAPDLFVFAANLLELKPSQCVVVEDAAVGVEAAIAAGMMAVGIGPSDRFKTANVILSNLINVRWSDLQLKLKASRAD
ncbi:MAG: HAD-IA family hydrolase [Chamaesiphon sp.]|nr:HAD-IA family hydrolase [Chamaesiphon sp.]